jgi:hypothetical protein
MERGIVNFSAGELLFVLFCLIGLVFGIYKTIRLHNNMLETQQKWHKAYRDYLTQLSKHIKK